MNTSTRAHCIPNGPTTDDADGQSNASMHRRCARKSMHTVSRWCVFNAMRQGNWALLSLNDPLNRRYTGATEMSVSGPFVWFRAYSSPGTRPTVPLCAARSTIAAAAIPRGALTSHARKTGPAILREHRQSRRPMINCDALALAPMSATRYGWDTACW